MLKEFLSNAAAYGSSLASNPNFLIGVGIGTNIAGGVIAFLEGTKVSDDIRKKEAELGRELSKPEKGVVYAKRAVLPTAVMAAGGAFIVIGTQQHLKTIEVLTGSLQAANLYANTQGKKLQEFEGKVREMVGDKKTEEIHDNIAKDAFRTNPPILGNNIIDTGPYIGMPTVFRFAPTGDYFISSYTTVSMWEGEINKIFTKGSCTQADLCEIMHLPYGELEEAIVYIYNGDPMEFKMRPDEGGWLEMNDGTQVQFCDLRVDKDPTIYEEFGVMGRIR